MVASLLHDRQLLFKGLFVHCCIGLFTCFLAVGLLLARVYDSYTQRMHRAVRYLYSRELRGCVNMC